MGGCCNGSGSAFNCWATIVVVGVSITKTNTHTTYQLNENFK